MLFNSVEFIIFFPLVCLVYYIIPQKFRYLWLLAASYYFYMCWNAKYALLLLASTGVTYVSGLLLNYAQQKYVAAKALFIRKTVVAVSFIINLGILFFYKYINFSTDLLMALLAKIHVYVKFPSFDLILPVGISFFTFQALSYTMDVYRNKIYAEKNFFRYALYVSFFPQLVAGPIERSKNLLKQLSKPYKFDFDKARDGFLLMLWGYFLKIVLADRIAVLVDTVFDNYTLYTGWFSIVAAVLFAVQIYCDFAGYSTIAIGAAEILGIRLMQNFEAPYTAQSVSEFWRRWHISLTSWFRDYLYIPLGGNRKGKLRKNINRLIVFLLSGLWHGAGIHFVFWGGLNGLYQILGEVMMPVRKKITEIFRLDTDSLGFKVYRTAVTFVLVDFAWIYFRAGSFSIANSIVRSIIHTDNHWVLFDGALYRLGLGEKDFRLMLLSIAVLIFVDIMNRLGLCIRDIIARQDYIARWLVIVFSVFFILTFGMWGPGYNANSFIYFQF